MFYNISDVSLAGLEIATDMVTNATNIFSLATKSSGLVAILADSRKNDETQRES